MTGVSSEIIVEPEKDIILTGRTEDYVVAADRPVHGSVMFLVMFIMQQFSLTWCLSFSGSRFKTLQ